jgi:hypothetical protein
MRFMMMIKSDAQTEAGVLPDEKVLTEMGRFNQALVDAGVLLGAEGLQASAKGARVRWTGGKVTVLDGPYTEAKELIAGYWLIQTKTREEAVAWAARCPGAALELRQLYELEDFPADPSEKQGGWRDQEERFREEAAAKAPARLPGTKRYMVMIKSDAYTEAAPPSDPKVFAAMGELMAGLAASGALLAGEGLKPTAQGVRVSGLGAARTVVDGPFAETKECIAGYSMIQVKTKAEAIDLAKGWLKIHAEGGGLHEAEIEIREVFEMDDIPVRPEEKADGWRQQEKRMREQMGQ